MLEVEAKSFGVAASTTWNSYLPLAVSLTFSDARLPAPVGADPALAHALCREP